MGHRRFLLEVEFKPRKSNGDCDFLGRTTFWSESFAIRGKAMIKFMRMVANQIKFDNNKQKPFCNLRGRLIENPNTPDEKILFSWDWEDVEIRWEWERSPECDAWIEEISSTPSAPINRNRIDSGVAIIDLLLELKLCPSKGDARRQIEQGGVRINDTKISDVKRNLLLDDFQNKVVLLSRGKKNKHKLQLE